MTDGHKKGKRDLPRLKRWADKLLDLTERSISKIVYKQDDHLSFMAMCFLCKQIDHLKSIIKLVPSRDVILVARSMIEGLCQLLWAANCSGDLPLRWRAYSVVSDWRLQKDMSIRKGKISSRQNKLIKDKLRVYGPMFLKKKYKEMTIDVNNITNDPFQNNWRDGYSIENICGLVGGDTLYEKAYRQFSAWHHRDASGLGQAIKRNNAKVFYTSLSEADSSMAVAIGFQCLIQTLEIADSQLKLGIGDDVSKVKEDYIKWHQSRNNYV
ncbi:MAG: DUF5677 domain-containing protein [Minisyncoccota bacterium]